MKNGIVIGTIACVVAIILIGSALAPIINITTTTTTTIDNDGAVGLRMDKVSSGDFTINYGLVGDDFTATNGTDTQVIDDLCIFYADNNVAVWMDDNSIIMLGKDADNNMIDEKLSEESTITITKSSAGLEITDGTITQTFPVPTWAYVPKSTGSFGFFLNETEINTGGLPVQYVGSFAGVNCYNSINTYDLPITIDAALTDSVLSGAKWIKQATETAPEELNPDDLHIIPLDPSIISIDNPQPDISILSVPTPTYTDGDWGYDLDANGKAIIVSYSGASDNQELVIPAKIGGYDVISVGKGGSDQTVMSTTKSKTNITVSEGIESINDNAFYGCYNLKGSLTLPSTLKSLGQSAFSSTAIAGNLILPNGLETIKAYAFSQCIQLDGSIVIPSTVTTIGNSAFAGCSGFDGSIVIPSSVSSIGNNVFINCGNILSLVSLLDDNTTLGTNDFNNTTSLKTILNLGKLELTTTSYGLNADTIRSDIPALGYLAPSQYKGTAQDDGPASVLLNVIPLITIVGVLMFAVGFTIYRRNY